MSRDIDLIDSIDTDKLRSINFCELRYLIFDNCSSELITIGELNSILRNWIFANFNKEIHETSGTYSDVEDYIVGVLADTGFIGLCDSINGEPPKYFIKRETDE
jgi:hypothetical protein